MRQAQCHRHERDFWSKLGQRSTTRVNDACLLGAPRSTSLLGAPRSTALLGRRGPRARLHHAVRTRRAAVAFSDELLIPPSGTSPSSPSDRLQRCSVLSAALQISVQQAMSMATRSPQVLKLSPTHVWQRCGQLQQLLELNAYEATALLVGHPDLLLPPGDVGATWGGDLRPLALQARQVAEVLDTTYASAMKALCRMTEAELAAVMVLSPQELQQQLGGLQAAVFPRPRPFPPPAAAAAAWRSAAGSSSAASSAAPSHSGSSSSTVEGGGGGDSAAAEYDGSSGSDRMASVKKEGGWEGDSMSEEGGGMSEEDVLHQRRQRLISALVLKWPTLLAIPPRQVAANMAHLVRRLRLPARRVAVLAARVPLLLVEPHQMVERRLAALGELLRVGPQALLQMLVSSPLLLREDVEDVRTRIAALSSLLGMVPAATVELVGREPNLLRYPPAQVQRKLSRLAATLKLSPPTAAALVVIHPYLLLSAPGHLSARVQDLGLVLSIPPARVVQMVLRYPRLLSYDVGKLRAHYDGLRAFGGLSGPSTPLLVQHPWLLLLPPAAVAARTLALASLFESPQAVVVQMVWRNPVFLAKSPEWVQATLDILTQVLGLARHVAVAAVQRAPVLLAYPHHSVRARCATLRKLASSHPEWQRQVDSMQPEEAAVCLRYGRDTLRRLQWLLEEGRQGGVSLVDFSVRDPHRFAATYPSADRRAVALAVLQQQQQQQQPTTAAENTAMATAVAATLDAAENTAAGAAEAGGGAAGEAGASGDAGSEVEQVVVPGGAAGGRAGSRWGPEEKLATAGAGKGDRQHADLQDREGSRKSGRGNKGYNPGGRSKWVGGRPNNADFL